MPRGSPLSSRRRPTPRKLARPAAIAAGRQVGGRGGGGDAERVVGVVAPGQVHQGASRRQPGRPAIARRRPSGPAASDPPGHRHRAGRCAAAARRRPPAARRVAGGSPRSASRVGHLAAARIADVDHERRGSARRRADPRGEHVEHRRPVGEHVRVVPLGVEVSTATAGPVRVEVAGVLVGLDDEPGPLPQRAVAAGRAGQAAGRSAPTNARRVAPRADEQVDQPAATWWTCRACPPPPGGAGRRSARRRRRPAATPRPGSRRATAARSSGWSGSTDVSALVTARPVDDGSAAASATWDGRGPRLNGMPRASSARGVRRGPPGSQPVTAAPACAASSGRRGRAGPAAPTTWIRSPVAIGRAAPVGREAAADLLRLRVTTRRRSGAGRAPAPATPGRGAAPPRRSSACSRPGRRTRSGAPRRPPRAAATAM